MQLWAWHMNSVDEQIQYFLVMLIAATEKAEQQPQDQGRGDLKFHSICSCYLHFQGGLYWHQWELPSRCK